jgi:hypothetical protein
MQHVKVSQRAQPNNEKPGTIVCVCVCVCVCVSECEATHHLRRRCAACAVSSRPTDKKPLYIARQEERPEHDDAAA